MQHRSKHVQHRNKQEPNRNIMRRCNAFPQNITEIWKLQHRSKHVQHRDKRMRQNIMLLEDVSFVLILPNVQVMLNKMQ